MRRGLLLGLGVAGVYAWLVAASSVYCYGTEHLALLRFPYLQWLQILPDWSANASTALWFWLGAAAPTALIILAVVVVFRWRKLAPNIYGKSAWAMPKQMRAGGLGLREKL